MMTPEEKRNILVAIGVLAVVAIILILWLMFRDRPDTTPADDEPAQPIREIEVTELEIEQVTPDRAAATTVARNFVERFGTFSSDNPYANYDDVEELSTEAFYATLTRSVDDSLVYKGTTTRVLAVSVVDGSEETGGVEYRISAQREVFENDRTDVEVVYAAANMTVVRVGDVWLVDQFQWE